MAREYLHPLFTRGVPTFEGADCAYFYEALPSRSYYRIRLHDAGLKPGATKYTPRYRITREYLDLTKISLRLCYMAIRRGPLPRECYNDPAELLVAVFNLGLAKVERERVVTNARESLIRWRKDVLLKISGLRQGARGSELNNKGTAIKILRTAA